MGNAFDYVLTIPFSEPKGGEVEKGLDALGFKPLDQDREVWGRFDAKLPARMGIDQFRDAVLALPWNKHRVGIDIQVLWRDEYVNDDDGWGGRRAPYSWHHDTWSVIK